MKKEKMQFISVLKLIPDLLDENNWTENEEKTFGIVILEVESEDEAQSIMKNDPTVAEGIMTAELLPYKVALIRT